MLARPDGERTLTDLRHIGQLLHDEAVAGGLGSPPWRRGCAAGSSEARQDVANEDRSRRLESDSEAVQVLTIHRSKGLEFPIVYCPYLWNEGWIDRQATRPCSTTRRPATGARSTSAARTVPTTRPTGSATSTRSAARSCASPTWR